MRRFHSNHARSEKLVDFNTISFVLASECSLADRTPSTCILITDIFVSMYNGGSSQFLFYGIFRMHGSIVYIDLFDSKDLLLPRNLS